MHEGPAIRAIAHRDRYAVIGHPVAHSKSPVIHAAFAAATQQAIRYLPLLAPLDGFTATVLGFIAGGGRGLNVTVPFKVQAFDLADALTPRARAAGAVNTLRFDDDDDSGGVRIVGDNTDGAGLVRDLEDNLGCLLTGRRVLLLGAGGAARGAVLPLLERQPAQLTITNRTAARAVDLQQRFAADAQRLGCILDVGGAVQRTANAYDVVINATASSLAGDLPMLDEGAIDANTVAYDMMYSEAHTVFMLHAVRFGARVHDGLGMLVEQAAESFAFWRGVRPRGRPVLEALRAGRDPIPAALDDARAHVVRPAHP